MANPFISALVTQKEACRSTSLYHLNKKVPKLYDKYQRIAKCRKKIDAMRKTQIHWLCINLNSPTVLLHRELFMFLKIKILKAVSGDATEN